MEGKGADTERAENLLRLKGAWIFLLSPLRPHLLCSPCSSAVDPVAVLLPLHTDASGPLCGPSPMPVLFPQMADLSPH